jgi:hypothetical protein
VTVLHTKLAPRNFRFIFLRAHGAYVLLFGQMPECSLCQRGLNLRTLDDKGADDSQAPPLTRVRPVKGLDGGQQRARVPSSPAKVTRQDFAGGYQLIDKP